MKLKPSTLTASVVLVAAILGGAFGGALVQGGGPAPTPTPTVDMHYPAQTSQETTMTPEPTPDVPEAPVPVLATDGGQAPTPVAATAPKGETAAKAADRAEDAADRADNAATRAEDAASKPAAPSPTPKPAPPAPDCQDGAKRAVPYPGKSGWVGGQVGEDTCVGGKWTRTKEPVAATPAPAHDGGPISPDAPVAPVE